MKEHKHILSSNLLRKKLQQNFSRKINYKDSFKRFLLNWHYWIIIIIILLLYYERNTNKLNLFLFLIIGSFVYLYMFFKQS